jgi:cyclic pyranopterin phosphate synthase
MTIDRFGRNIHYIRISLTDHCNLRCVYCMPEDMTFRPTAEMMSFDEIVTLSRLMAELGFDKFRLTGGEPTVHPKVVDIVREIAVTPGVRSISLTTNGILLKKLAEPLAKAGLQRVNVSLDTLDPVEYRRITRRGQFAQVWDGIMAAEAAGLKPIKLNAVIVRNFNEKSLVDLSRLTYDHHWQIRFIEMMPFGGATSLQLNQVVKSDEMRQRIQETLGPLELANQGELDGEAQMYKLAGSLGEVGFISSVSVPFCAACSRARLTADGHLRLCLLRDNEVDLLTPLRAGATISELRQLILDGIWSKPWGHGLAEGEFATNRIMSEIGG